MTRRDEREQVFQSAIAAEVVRQREARGVCQAKFARHMGINQVTMSSYERGRNAIPLYRLLRMAAALKVTLADLVGPAVQKAAAITNVELTRQ